MNWPWSKKITNTIEEPPQYFTPPVIKYEDLPTPQDFSMEELYYIMKERNISLRDCLLVLYSVIWHLEKRIKGLEAQKSK